MRLSCCCQISCAGACAPACASHVGPPAAVPGGGAAGRRAAAVAALQAEASNTCSSTHLPHTPNMARLSPPWLALLLLAGVSCAVASPNFCRPKCTVAVWEGQLRCGDVCDRVSCEGGTTCKVQNGKPVCVNPCTCIRCHIGQQCAVKLDGSPLCYFSQCPRCPACAPTPKPNPPLPPSPFPPPPKPTCASRGQKCLVDLPCCSPNVCAGPGAICFHY
ncbi:hypothetical protein ABPG75_013393 [Micractinium tetrahymenae]